MHFKAILTFVCIENAFQVDYCSNFWRFLSLRTSIFAIPYNVFHGFSYFKLIASKMLPKSLLSSKNLPRWLQNTPKSLPRRSQDASKSSQDRSKSPQDPSRRPKKTPKRPLTAPKMRQRGSKMLPRGSKRLPREEFGASGKDFDASRDRFWSFQG